MKNWDDLKFCQALHRHGTMSDAAKVLNTNVATVSRRLHRLSEEIGETLFIKQGNRWVTTEAGAELAQIAEHFQAEIGRSSAAGEGEAEIEIQIRISCAMQLIQCGFASAVADFLGRHPLASLRFETQKRSLALNECDVRLDFDEPSEGRIVRRLFTTLDLVPACAEPFRDRIEGWINVLYSGREGRQARLLEEHFGAPPRIELEGLATTLMILRNAPLAAAVPVKCVETLSDLTALPGPESLTPLPVWLSYHETRRRDHAVRLAIEFLQVAFNIGETPEPETHAQ